MQINPCKCNIGDGKIINARLTFLKSKLCHVKSTIVSKENQSTWLKKLKTENMKKIINNVQKQNVELNLIEYNILLGHY